MLRTQNLHVVKTEPLIPPAELKADLPADDAIYEVVVRARQAIRDAIAGREGFGVGDDLRRPSARERVVGIEFRGGFRTSVRDYGETSDDPARARISEKRDALVNQP